MALNYLGIVQRGTNLLLVMKIELLMRCPLLQTMTEAEHNQPIPKLFSNRPLASAAEVFGLLREPIIFFENNM